MSRRERYRELDVKLLGEAMISDEAVATLRELCDTYGSRFAGSKGERRAGEFLLGRMRAIGLERVHAERFPLLAWQRGRKPVLKAVAPAKLSVEAIALPYSPPTRKGGLDLELADLGMGMPEDFRRMRRAIKGKAVIATSESPGYYPRWVHRAEKYAMAVRAGAKAFLFMNHYDGNLTPTGSVRFNRRAEIPGLGVAKEAGCRMLRLADQGPVTLHIETFDKLFRSTSRNLVGELRGSERPDEIVIVGGHYDCHDIAPGANDNASGAATVLEAARLLAPHRAALKRTVRFICFGCEEVGLVGGHAYADRHAAELAQVRLMVNVDGVGYSRGKGFNFQGWDEAKAPLDKMAADMHLGIGFASRPNAYTDHFPFLVAGVPSCWIGNVGGAPSGRTYEHTAADTFDKVARADLREVAALLARSLVRFANDPHWALRHKSKAEVLRLLDRFEILDDLRAQGILPDALK